MNLLTIYKQSLNPLRVYPAGKPSVFLNKGQTYELVNGDSFDLFYNKATNTGSYPFLLSITVPEGTPTSQPLFSFIGHSHLLCSHPHSHPYPRRIFKVYPLTLPVTPSSI